MAAGPSADGTVAKALDVLDLVAASERPVRFSDLLDKCTYPKATLYRLLRALLGRGMLIHDADTGGYALSMRLVRLASVAWEQSSLATIARPYLDQLSAEVDETVHLAKLDHAQVLFVDRRDVGEPTLIYSQANKVGPAYCTGVGKAMLAFLPQAYLQFILAQQSWHSFTDKTLTSPEALQADLTKIRARGFACDDEEHEQRRICVAVPILSSTGSVLGALSVASTTLRTELAALQMYVPTMCEFAQTIAAEAECWCFPEVGADHHKKERSIHV